MPARARKIADVVEYVPKLPHQAFHAARVKAGHVVFEDEGGCFDRHTADGIGDSAIGATDLTLPQT